MIDQNSRSRRPVVRICDSHCAQTPHPSLGRCEAADAVLTARLARCLVKAAGGCPCNLAAVWVSVILTQMSPLETIVTLSCFGCDLRPLRWLVGLGCCIISFSFAFLVLVLAFAFLAFASLASFAIDGVKSVSLKCICLGNGG